MNKILFSRAYTEGIRQKFADIGYQTFALEEQLERKEKKEILDILQHYVKKHGISHVFTLDFSADVAEACHKHGVIYVSWVWDSPHTVLWANEARYDTNRIFLFEYAQFLIHRGRGLQNVFYLPIAPDVECFKECIKKKSGDVRTEYCADISFVGNLYNDAAHSLYDQIGLLPEYIRGFLDGLMNAQRSIWGMDFLESTINERIFTQLKQYVKWDIPDHYEDGFYEVTMRNIIGQKIAQLERKEMCSRLAEKFSFNLYTDCDTSFDPNIRNMGHADYRTEMPLIFHNSKININLTIRSIPSGIPLRVMDVLACGGFLLTNYQAEIAEYFEDGKELVIFTDFEDLYQKVEYFLQHEEERRQIAMAGQKKIEECFSYERQIGFMDEVLNEDGRSVY